MGIIKRLREAIAEYEIFIKMVEQEFANKEKVSAENCLGFDCNNCRCDLSPDCD